LHCSVHANPAAVQYCLLLHPLFENYGICATWQQAKKAR
jgi:hypothetical protein